MRSCLIFSCIVLIVTANDIQADQNRKNIGVTRAAMMSLFQKPPLRFVFGTETRIKDGRLRIRAESEACPEYYLTAELIGPRQGYVQQAPINFAIDSSITEACRAKESLALTICWRRYSRNGSRIPKSGILAVSFHRRR